MEGIKRKVQQRTFHEPRHESRRSQNLAENKWRAIVELSPDHQRKIDDDVPHGNEWREIIGDIIGVHGICEQDGEQIHPD